MRFFLCGFECIRFDRVCHTHSRGSRIQRFQIVPSRYLFSKLYSNLLFKLKLTSLRALLVLKNRTSTYFKYSYAINADIFRLFMR